MGRHFWKTTQLLVACLVHTAICKSCHYDNLHALSDWLMLKSPGYPRQFPAQTQCWWKISAPPQYRIQLELTYFSLVRPNSKNQCVWQWLNIIEGNAALTNQPPMLTLCGSNGPRLVISKSNTLRLNLHSNSAAANSRYTGFTARYKYTTEESFTPDVSNKLMNPVAPSSVSVGDAMGSLPKPISLPPNPNAVLTLKNKRTEARNRARNAGVNDQNGANGYGEPSYGPRRRQPPPQQYGRLPTRYLPTMSNEVRTPAELPPRRSKPLPQEIKILLAVLGTVGGVILILYLIKKFVYDKAHKKSSGKIVHAYAHFRRFKKKKTKDPEEGESSKVNTITASIASVNGTMRSRDSGIGTPNEIKAHENVTSVFARDDESNDSRKRTDRTKRIQSEKTTSTKNHLRYPNLASTREADGQAFSTERGKDRELGTISRFESQSSSSSGNQRDADRGGRERRRRERRRVSRAEPGYRERDLTGLHGGRDGARTSRRPDKENWSREQRSVNDGGNNNRHKGSRATNGRTSTRNRTSAQEVDNASRRNTWRDKTYSRR